MIEGKMFNHAHGPGINVGLATDHSEVILHLQTPERVQELTAIFARALNTWTPESIPEWAVDLMDKFTGMPPPPGRQPSALKLDGL